MKHGDLSANRNQLGFTYFWVLIAVFIISLSMVAVSEMWANTVAREKLSQLDWSGRQIVSAIGSYYESTPGLAKKYPQDFSDLLEDRRQGSIRRHLREIYTNPFSGKNDWDVIKTNDGAFKGVTLHIASIAAKATKVYIYYPNDTLSSDRPISNKP